MTQSVAENEDDLLTLMFMLCGGMATGMFSFGVLLHPVRDWMLQYHLLANGTEVVIPFIDGIGFGWPQIVVASGLIAALVATVVWLRRRARERV
ncbi:MAG: hypothetical protein BGN98_03635 [Microbacterium sp. 69-7]|jgi:hypothetical protein|uniref:hypothetical protein n=1 Tax=Microbacterium TaxID=33882 RepID=UPI00076A091D|nr:MULTISPECIES: hypothetical protein [Microbacterium]MAT19320.1 hypothetical protein [Leifsonia sp.]MCT2223777.1 hypothetical protein [Microbacterium paraoxydans]OJU43243.1 MAG: hypothetical protein BGN98_03635 [Microbacterium sp. 69-7]